MILQGERQRLSKSTVRSRASLVLALGYAVLLLLVLLHRHPVHGFSVAAPAHTTSVAQATVSHLNDAMAPVGGDCLLCNLLELPTLGFVGLLVAFVLRVCAEFFANYQPKQHVSPRLVRKQPRAPPVYS